MALGAEEEKAELVKGGSEAKKASGLPELTGLAVSRRKGEGPWGEFTEVRGPPGAWSKAPGGSSKMLGKTGKVRCAGRRALVGSHSVRLGNGGTQSKTGSKERDRGSGETAGLRRGVK